MTATNYKFEGWVGMDEKAADGNLVYQEINPKPWDEDDVDVKVVYNGICGSDVSALSGHFGPIHAPRVCGHEITGQVVRVGSKVQNNLKVGDWVGIGPQSDSCRECNMCKKGKYNLCAKFTFTYGGSLYHRGHADGTLSVGGFANYWRGPSSFVVPIPDGLDAAAAAPLCCGGLTVYSALKRWGAGTERKNVGIVGVGGLGHLGIMIAKAMGATVTAISRGEGKRNDALELGATQYIPTGSDLAADFKTHAASLDLIICTINPPELPVANYLSLLAGEGMFVQVGVVLKDLAVPTIPLVFSSAGVAGSSTGTPKELAELFLLAVKHNINTWIQKFGFEQMNEAMPGVKAGKPKFRYVLVNRENGGKL